MEVTSVTDLIRPTGTPPGTEVCPECGHPGERIHNATVKSMVAGQDVGDHDYSLCPNPACEVVYFRQAHVFRKGDVRVRVWFKETEEPLPICYCSNLTRHEIVEAVKAGNTTIEAVRKATGAMTTGKCLTENPTGRCCHKVFQEIIVTQPISILFLCTGNSCRSQMAEGWTNFLHAGRIAAFSAGTEPGTVNPRAVKVMAEAGVDLSGHRAKHLKEFLGQPFDYVVTLCDNAQAVCPVFPGAGRTVHAGFPDPAQASGTPEEVLEEFRRVRDQLREFVAELPHSLERRAGAGGLTSSRPGPG